MDSSNSDWVFQAGAVLWGIGLCGYSRGSGVLAEYGQVVGEGVDPCLAGFRGLGEDSFPAEDVHVSGGRVV